jgi:hypothetical protein
VPWLKILPAFSAAVTELGQTVVMVTTTRPRRATLTVIFLADGHRRRDARGNADEVPTT